MRKTMSIILMTAIIGSTVVSTPVSLFAKEDVKTQEKTDADKKKEEAAKKEEERIKSVRDEGSKLGEQLGQKKGEALGREDFARKNGFDWQKRYKSLGNIVPSYNTNSSNEYLEGFKEGYIKAFEKGYNDAYIELLTQEVKVELGYAIETGEKDAIADFYANLSIDPNRHLLEEEEAIIRFKLTDEEDFIKNFFYVEYLLEYQKAYDEKYRELRKENFDRDRAGYGDGKKVGEKQGIFSGKIDFVTPGSKNNWEASLKKFENQKSIVQRYFLDREPVEYRESFIIGFKEAYREAYDKTYKASNIEIAENNINYAKIAATGGVLEFKPSDGVGSLGGTLTIDNATFYQETHLGISMDRDSFNYKNLKYKPINHVYNVAVNNQNGVIELEKPMKLNLEHHASDKLSGKAGIYQLVNNEWRYIYTKQTLGNLEAEIPAGVFRGGKYAIFIDENYKMIEDIRSHWAKEELETFLRRGYIKGYEENNGTYYYPNTTMKRAHFVELLGKVLGWNYEGMHDDTSKFKDSQYFGEYKDAINYAANMGYINGTPDGNFKPFDTLTYQQVEWILRSVMFDNQFKWDGYQQDIIKDKHTQPASVQGKKSPIKRGEVVYMLHEIQKKNLI